jgi:CHAT domain-containing protein
MSVPLNFITHRDRPRSGLVLKLAASILKSAPLLLMASCQTTQVPSKNSLDINSPMARGAAAMRDGDTALAISNWKEAAANAAASGKAGERFDALIDLKAAYESLGKFEEAGLTSRQAADLVPGLNSPVRQLTALLSEADLYTFTHRDAEAQDAIDQGLDLSRRLRSAPSAAALENAQGNLRVRQERYPEAMTAFAAAAASADQFGGHALRARALANGATAATLAGDSKQAVQFGHDALAEIGPMQSSRQKLTLLLTVGQSLESPLPGEAKNIYEEAAAAARQAGDRQSLSYALGYQGRLCRALGQNDQALRLTRQAAFVAQSIQNPQALYRWQWQAGQILAGRGDLDEAIAEYDSAINSLESVRLDLTLGNGNSAGGTFRNSVGPIYYEMADLLLRRADGQPESDATQALYRKARATVEQLKSAQLEDYFQDRCEGLLKARAREVEAVDPHTAVIYYISLPDRIETLVSIGAEIRRFTAPISASQLLSQTREFRISLEDRTTRQYLSGGQALYNMLLLPLEPALHEHQIDTLVFVPDGPLRVIPFAAIHDGDDFLVRRYAIAVTPGLTLMDPRPIARRGTRVLGAGLSESVFGYPALAYVPGELESVRQIFGGRQLLDGDFSKTNLRSELNGNDYTIVHIASHMEFGNTARSTYLVTHGEKLDLDEVEALILPTRFRDQPLELLTLDCCNTARDDERSTQGMAGIAIEAGARSAVATLWPVNDEAAPELIEYFYRALHDHPELSKAKAMQQAQLRLMQDDRFAHPENWAPYLVIGNWL